MGELMRILIAGCSGSLIGAAVGSVLGRWIYARWIDRGRQGSADPAERAADTPIMVQRLRTARASASASVPLDSEGRSLWGEEVVAGELKERLMEELWKYVCVTWSPDRKNGTATFRAKLMVAHQGRCVNLMCKEYGEEFHAE